MEEQDRQSREYSEPFRIHNSRGSKPPEQDRRETPESVRPIADLMLCVAHADEQFCEEERRTVRWLLRGLLGVNELPEKLEAHIQRFDPSTCDLKATIAAFNDRSSTTRRRLLELLRAVCDADATYHLKEERFMLDLVTDLALEPEEYADLVVREASGVNGPWKRALDLVLGSIALALLALPMLMVAGAVKLSSPGPVFFRQRRYGRDGREILVYKFRSMRVMENGPKVTQVMKRDPRVTRVGEFIRRTSLDELPQLFNVMLGDMSLVGPRPHAVAHNEEYGSRIVEYSLRHKIKPGITGWAQVNGWRGETDTLRKMVYRVEYDLEYIRRWSLWFDLRIMWLTVFGRKVRQNAY